MKGRITAFRDRGTLKFRITQNGVVIGFLNLYGLIRWMDAQTSRKPTEGTVSYLKQK